MSIRLDPIDKKIVHLLLENARRPTSEIARLVGIGRATAHERISRLEQSGTIAGYTTVLRRDPFQGATEVLALLTITQRRQRDVVKALKMLPEVVLCGSVSGNSDMVVSLRTIGIEDIDSVIDEIVHIDGVDRCQSWVLLGQPLIKRP